MDKFTIKGDEENPDSFWLIDGSEDFAIIPGNTISGISHDMPIKLSVGNQFFGERHISIRHNLWVKKSMNHKNEYDKRLVPALLHKKLNQAGVIYEAEKKKLVILLRLSPNTTLILKNRGQYLSVTTFYYKENSPDELWVEKGDYLSSFGTKKKNF